MANHTSRRLKQIHYDTAGELRWIYKPLEWQPNAPRQFKQRATLWLKRLVQEAKINSEGMTREQMYLESVRALRGADGNIDSYPALMVQGVVEDWEQLCCEHRQNKKQDAQAAPATTVQPIKTTHIAKNNDSFEGLGIYADDTLERQSMRLDEFRADDLVMVWNVKKEEWSLIGRFLEADDEQFCLQLANGRTYDYVRDDKHWTFYLVVAVIRRTPLPRGDEATAEQSKREAQIKALQRRADKLTSNVEESERFQVLKQIYDLERETNTDEWPDEIAA